MKKLILLFAGIVLSLTTRAHNPQLSTVTMVQDAGKQWGLLVTVPLTTCEVALRGSYAGMATDSMDMNRFTDSLADLIKKQSLFIVNGSDTLTLTTAKINPGHETEIFFQFQERVDSVGSLRVVFDPFASLTDHNTIFRMYQSGQSAGNFILNRENNYSLTLEKEGERFSVFEQPPISQNNLMLPILLISILLLSAVAIAYKVLSNKVYPSPKTAIP